MISCFPLCDILIKFPFSLDNLKTFPLRLTVIFLVKGSLPKLALPDGWIALNHRSGGIVYLHKPTRVCTWSRPYHIGGGSVRVLWFFLLILLHLYYYLYLYLYHHHHHHHYYHYHCRFHYHYHHYNVNNIIMINFISIF